MSFFRSITAFIKNDNPQAKISWSLYNRVWREIGLPYWKLLLAGIIFTLIAAAAEAYTITLVKKVIDKGFIEKNMTSLYFIGVQIVIAYLIKGLFGYGKTLAMARAGLLGATHLRRRIYRHMVHQHIGFFHTSKTGPLMNNFTGLANAVLGLVTNSVMNIVQSIATLCMMLGLMIWYAPQMTAVLVFLIPAILIPLTIIMRKLREVSRNSFGADAGSISHITQTILGIKTIQAFSAEKNEIKNMDDIEDYRVKVGFRSVKLSGIQTPFLEVIISLGLCAALIIGGHFIVTGTISTGDFTAFMLAMSAAYKPAKSLTSISGGIQNGIIAAEGLFEFIDKKSGIIDTPQAATLTHQQMAVTLDHVSFAYHETDGNVLHDLCLEVKPGKICAFVGLSGGGKSTIFNLLLRFYDPQRGAVKINGTDIRHFTLSSLRHNIASVSQDVFLFNGTIADNIRYGCPDATQQQIEDAAKAAHAHDFIMSFPSQYNNKVGEFGALLSGGQKQRIAIARAILKDSPILLLDEATSALDSQSEKLIQVALNELMQGRTTFVIAHRLATVLDADIICVIKDGRIVEQGSDAELMALQGEYKKLKDIQFRDTKEDVDTKF